MNTYLAHQDLVQTCQLIGADFSYDEAEHEARACIMRGSQWWQLVADLDADDQLWHHQLHELRQQLQCALC